MPCTAVSAAWASSAGLSASARRSSSPRSIAFAMALSVRIFGAERPARASLAERARSSAAWSNGSKASVSRAPDRFRAGGRELLRDHDRGEPGKSVRPSPQRRPSGARQHVAEARVGADQAGDGVIEIGFGVDEEGHGRRRSIYKCHRNATLFLTDHRSAAHDPSRLPFRAESERPSASRPCALRAEQFRLGARGGRALPAAHRGHRRRALPAGLRAGDLRGPGVARHHLGGAGAAPERAFRRLPRGAGALDALGLVYPSFESRARSRAGRRAGDARVVAARSRRRAALSRRCTSLAPAERRGGWRPACPMRCASTWRRRSRAPAR